MKESIKDVNRKKEFICDGCGFRCKSVDEYDGHVKSHQITIYNCGKCELQYNSIQDVNIHIDLKHKPKPEVITEVDPVNLECLRSCDRCDFVADVEDDLKDHYVQSIHNIQDKNKTITEDAKEADEVCITILECKKCKKRFENESNLKKHIEEEHHHESIQLLNM